uniref:ORF64a n=1 Tax=Pinus koraiensis TaxID=88728 RepID=Q85X45_PINKO|nr:ORF64a [Pinus koraiensis]AAO74018.1 ORF64a [Pinus koraiensis]
MIHSLGIFNLKTFNYFIVPGSMPEWLMRTDCKSVGNMPTLVQIQLDPTNIINTNLSVWLSSCQS